MTAKKQTSKSRPGPEPERLNINDDWERAVKRALRKKAPPKEKKAEKGS